jgi:hypothetical protein
MKVTDDEHVHDSKALPELVNEIVKSNKIIGKLLFADDWAYERNDILDICPQTMESCPCIKVRKNAKIQLKDSNFIRNLSVISQKKDLQKWEEDSIVSYGQRLIVVETVFFSIKRMSGRKYVYSVRLKNMIRKWC